MSLPSGRGWCLAPNLYSPTIKCWGLFLPLTLSSLCLMCWFWLLCLLSRRIIGNKDLPLLYTNLQGNNKELSQELSPNWDWVLPFSFVLCSLVCPQTHTKKPSLDMETDVPHNAFPRISFIYLFIYFWKEEIDGFFFFSCLLPVFKFTPVSSVAPQDNTEHFLWLWITGSNAGTPPSSSACSTLWATMSAAINGFLWPSWNIFLGFSYFGDKLLSGV